MMFRVVVGLWFVLCAATAAAWTQGTTALAAETPRIVSMGMGEVRAPPDHALITFTVQTGSVDAASAGRENAALMASLRRGLEKHGIPQANMSTVGYSLRNEPRYQERPPKEPQNWFVARNGIRVTITNLEQAGATIDVALAAGANQVGDIAFRVADEGRLRRTAIAMAVKHARAQAEAMATAAGGRLGPLIELAPVGAPSHEGVAMLGARATPETIISRPEITFTERVFARWRFIPDAP